MKKRILLFCLIIIVAVASVALVSCGGAESGQVVSDGSFKFTSSGNGTCSVSGIDGAAGENIVIPDKSPAGDTVTGIGYRAFSDRSGIKSVKIPNTVTGIAKYAFSGCSGLTEIVIPDSVKNIADFAFENCIKLKSVTIGKGVKTIGKSAFVDCTDLEKVNISDVSAWCGISFVDYCSNPLYYARGLYMNGADVTEITTPSNLTSIAKYAFVNCSGLESITIGNSVKNVGISAFEGCDGLKTINFGGGVQSVEQSAFSGCINLTNLEIPGNVANIGQSAFAGCIELAGVTLGDGVKTIGASAFSGCSEIKAMVFPKSVTSIGDSAFEGCAELASMIVGKGVTSIGSSSFSGCSGLLSLTFEEGSSLKSIGDLAFAYCSELSGIVFPKSVMKIGDKAFRDCTALASIEVEDGNIVYRAEGNCLIKIATDSLILGCRTSEIPTDGSVVSIAAYAFQGCSELMSIAIPSSVRSIGSSAFSGCTGLEAVDISDLAAWCKILFSNAASNPLSYAHYLYINGEAVTDITIPSSVKSISKYAFEGCTGLSGVNITDLEAWCKISFGNGQANPLYFAENLYLNGEKVEKLVIPEGTTAISAYAFTNGKCFNEISLPESVANIGTYAFYGCDGLKEIKIPNGVINIGTAAFYNCSEVENLEISKSVKNIGYVAFFGCNKLANIKVEEGNTVFDSSGNCLIKTASRSLVLGCKNSVIPDDGSVISIGVSAFLGCKDLTEIAIPSTVKHIGGGAFDHCTGLRKVYITDLAAWCEITFGNSAANPISCAGRLYLNGELVTALVVPDSVDSINSYAFYGCTGLTSVNIGKEVKNIGSSVFVHCSKIEKIEVAAGNQSYRSENNCLIKVSNKMLVLGCKNSVIPTDGNVTSIGDNAFNDCVGLTTIAIPTAIKSIGSSAFSGCSGLVGVNITDLAAWCVISFSNESANPLEYAHNLYVGGELVKELVIPDSVKGISKYAFSGCSGITELKIGKNVANVGNSAFAKCTSISSITVDENNDYYRADGNCLIKNSTKTLVLGCKNSVIPGDGSVTKINSSAFAGCSELLNIEIPASVKSIGAGAFEGCTGLESVNIIDLAAWCGISFADKEANPIYCARNIRINGEAVTELVIPNNVKRISKYAFYGCSELIGITIGSGVKSIGTAVFGKCEKLETITVAKENAVYSSTGNCLIRTSTKALIVGCKNSEIPDNVASIGAGAFVGCKDLVEITIPVSVKRMRDGAFEDCTDLVTINYGGTTVQWNAIVKGGSWDRATGEYIVYCTDGTAEKIEIIIEEE